jgi:uncharacterized protein YlxW (UPF0749 family)
MGEDPSKASELRLPPLVSALQLEWKENNLKEKPSERDTEIDRLRKEVTSLQDQMAGQRNTFQVATESIRRDAERERAIGQRVERLTIEARDVPVADARH